MVSPCAYVVGLLDELVIDELELERRGLRYWVADPNLWVPFDDGTAFGQWLDDAKTAGRTSRSSASRQRTSTATGPTRSCSTTSASCCARASATPGSATRPTRDEIEELLGGDAGDDRPRLRGLDRRRARRPTSTTSALKTALFGQGIIGTWGGPVRPRHRLDQAHALPGRPRRPGPGLGLRRGRHGDGQLRDRRRRRARPARCSPAGSRSPRSSPARASTLEDGTALRARDRDLQRRPEADARDARRRRRSTATSASGSSAWKIRSPVVKFNAALERLPNWTAAPGRGLAGPGDDRRHRHDGRGAARVRALRAPASPPSPSARSTSRPATTRARRRRAST